jgi:hypothetical protein
MGTTQLLSVPYALYNGNKTFLTTDSLGEVKWQMLSGTQVQMKIFPDTLVWVKGQQVPAKDRVVNAGTIKARSIPLSKIAEGVRLDNSPQPLS